MISNRSPDEFQQFRKRYQFAFEQGRFKAAYSVDGWLLTHAGVSTALAADLPEAPFESGDAAAIAAWLCGEFERRIVIPIPSSHYRRRQLYGVGPLFQIEWTQGGVNWYGGLFWYDPQLETFSPDPRMRQIFGHTSVKWAMKRKTWIDIHIEDSRGYWVYDTESDAFALLKPEG